MNPKLKPVDISFRELSYIVPHQGKSGKKEILKSIDGYFKSGQVSAIMGPSGCGKTSLLNILTGVIKKNVTGDINMIGAVKKNNKLCSYILQDDSLFPWFTVEESMLLAASLKISNGSMSPKEKNMLIENILDTLKLSNTKQTKCSSLSGGQKKRLSIALELLDNPPILFLDEPTTGLDSSSCVDCIQLLHDLSQDGRTVICTIHQPSASIFKSFDLVYMLGNGHCVYQGPPGNIIEFLRSLDLHCPQYHNPADYMLEIVCGEHGDHIEKLRNSAKCMIFEQKSIKAIAPKDIARRRSSSLHTVKHIYPPAEWMKLWILIGRCHVQFYRDWTVTHLKLLMHILCSVLIGLFYGSAGSDATKALANTGLLIIGVVYLWYTTMMPGVLRFPQEMVIIKKESFNNWYKLRTYYLAVLITSTPVHILFSTVFSSIVFLMTDQPFELDRYMRFTLTYIVTTIAADGFGVLLGTIASPVNGTFFGAVSTCMMLLFSGYLILFDHMPRILRVISYISFHKYALEGLVLSIYDNKRQDLYCPDDEIFCNFQKPIVLLKLLGMSGGSYDFNISMAVIQIIFFKGLAYFTLKRAVKSG